MEEQEQKIKKIRQVHGNMLMVGIKLDLTVVTVMNGNVSKTKEDFYPNTDYPVSIVLKKGSSRYPYSASVNGNVVSFEDPGTLPVGVYEVEVLCRNAQAQPCRYMARSVIEIVDATIEAGIGDGVEFDSESYLLEGGVFLFAKGDKGDGIAGISVVESDEDDGYNVITITLTTGEEVTLHVKNGSKGYGISPETQQAILEGLERIKGLPVHRFLSESEYEALVNADEVDPDTIYHTYEDE